MSVAQRHTGPSPAVLSGQSTRQAADIKKIVRKGSNSKTCSADVSEMGIVKTTFASTAAVQACLLQAALSVVLLVPQTQAYSQRTYINIYINMSITAY